MTEHKPMDAEFPLAVHALVYLLHTERITSSEELADNICTNPARVRKVMARLSKAGYVTSMRGRYSGYTVEKSLRKVTLKEVLDALNETCICENWKSGDIHRDCQVSSGMGGVMDGIYGELNDACDRQLQKITVGNVFQKIFQK